MRILQLNNIQNTNFKSGLTAQILERESCIVPKQVENYFKNSPYNCNYYNFKNLDLKDNKAYALALRMCAEIFKNFSRNHNYSGYSYLKPKVFPSDIIVYNRDNLPDNMDSSKKDEFMKAFHTIGSYVPWSGTVIKNLKSSINIGSILIPNSIKKLEQLNEISDINKKEGFHSSGHFLSIFIHEWIHSIADYYLYQATDGGGKYDATLRAVKQKRLNDRENEIVRDILGEYASKQKDHQYSEVVAEAWAKFICDSLDKDCVHFKQDPVELMKNTPKEFRKILKKVSTIDVYEYSYITGKDKPSNRKAICFYPESHKQKTK